VEEQGIEVYGADPVADDLFDREDPRSLYNIVPRWLREAISTVDVKVMLQDEQTLRVSASADARLNRIRLAFWAEYEEAQAMVRNVDFYQVTRKTGITATFCKQLITRNQYTLAYVLHQPVEYSQFLEEALSAGLGRLREILDAPMKNPSGDIDHKMAELILKATAFIDLRVHGGIVEKRVQITQNQNHTVHEQVFSSKQDRTKSSRLLTGNSSATQLEALDAKIRELEGKQEYKDARLLIPEPELVTVEGFRGKKSPERGDRQADKVFKTKLNDPKGKKYKGTT